MSEIALICPDLQKEQTSVVNTVYYRWKFIGAVVDTSEQFIGGVIDTGEQFISGVIDTDNNIFPRCCW